LNFTIAFTKRDREPRLPFFSGVNALQDSLAGFVNGFFHSVEIL
jgi:hypothetical protein